MKSRKLVSVLLIPAVMLAVALTIYALLPKLDLPDMPVHRVKIIEYFADGDVFTHNEARSGESVAYITDYLDGMALIPCAAPELQAMDTYEKIILWDEDLEPIEEYILWNDHTIETKDGIYYAILRPLRMNLTWVHIRPKFKVACMEDHYWTNPFNYLWIAVHLLPICGILYLTSLLQKKLCEKSRKTETQLHFPAILLGILLVTLCFPHLAWPIDLILNMPLAGFDTPYVILMTDFYWIFRTVLLLLMIVVTLFVIKKQVKKPKM